MNPLVKARLDQVLVDPSSFPGEIKAAQHLLNGMSLRVEEPALIRLLGGITIIDAEDIVETSNYISPWNINIRDCAVDVNLGRLNPLSPLEELALANDK